MVNNNQKGFSLVELLVVVAILAILAAISIPLFLNQKSKALSASLRSDVRNLITEVETLKPPFGGFNTASVTRSEVLQSGYYTTDPNYAQVWLNCARNETGTAMERSEGNFVVDAYVRANSEWSIQSGTTRMNYDSKTRQWYMDNEGNFAIHIFSPTNPCSLGNGGEGSFSFYWNDGVKR